MAARATRSASRKARATEAVATGPLGALSHDELGVIFDGLADPLEPVIAVALSSTCLGLRTPLQAALEVLKERNEKVVALCRKVSTWHHPCSCTELRDAERLDWGSSGLTADDMATLGMILRTNGLPRLRSLELFSNGFGNAGMHALCVGLGPDAAPALGYLNLLRTVFGPVGAEALAAALGRGALPKLERLALSANRIGNHGVAALAAPLRSMPALKCLYLPQCGIGDEGLASLVANLGKDDFKKLEYLYVGDNGITDVGVARLAAAIDGGGLPALQWDTHALLGNPSSASARSAVQAVKDALAKRSSQ